jgi:hypothetical protein
MRLLLLSIIIWACSSVGEAQTVYVTKTGTKYHRESCHYLKYSKYAISLADAKKKSYEACKVCKPSTTVTGEAVKVDSPKAAPTPIPIKAAVSKQCSAIAKSTGNRCKRMTKSASGKCWQHE